MASHFASLLNPTPQAEYNPDDFDATGESLRPRIDEWSEDEDDAADAPSSSGRLRLRPTIDLGDIDQRYAGVKKSRRELEMESDSESDLEAFVESDGEEASGESDESETSDDSEQDDDKESQRPQLYKQLDEISSVLNDVERRDAYDPGTITNTLSRLIIDINARASMRMFENKVDAKAELNKARRAMHQMRIWDAMLTIRIHLQKAVKVANCMPQWFIDIVSRIGLTMQQGTMYQQMVRELQEDGKRTSQEVQEAARELLFNMHVLSRLEELPEVEEEVGRDLSVDEWWDVVSGINEKMTPVLVDTADYWARKTQLSKRLSQTKFKALNQDIGTQIERIVADKERMFKRVHTKRSEYHILGKRKADEMEEECDPEIFDDTDFYQLLLKELLERNSTTNETDEFAMTRAWLASRPEKKRKKNVDTGASKGRKIRYNVHEKLVGFMAPVEKDMPPYADRIFASLFKS